MKKIVQIILPIFAIFALWLVFCFPAISKDLVPFPSTYLVTFFPPWNASYGMPVKNNAMPDIITQIYPWKQITIDAYKHGQIPLWNPYSFAGTVHAGNYQSAIFSPMNILFILFPFINAWSLFIVLQPLMAGLGMFLFIKSLGRSRNASLIASIAFMFCGFMTTWMAYGTLGYAALCLPWALWAITVYGKNKSSWCLPIVSLSIAWSLVSGHFQISLYVVGTVILYILFLSLSNKSFKQGLLPLLYLCIGILLAAPQILLTFDAYVASTRSSSIIKGEIIPWNYLITLFSPDFFGNPVTRNDWFGHYAEWASYIGVVPLILAVFAILFSKKETVRFFTFLGFLSLFLAYQTPLNDLLYIGKLPVLSTSAASRIILIFSFSLAALSSFGLDELIIVWHEKKKKIIFQYIVGLIVFLVLCWVLLLFIKPFSLEKLVIAKRNMILPSVLALITMGCIGIGLLTKKKYTTIIVFVLLGISMFDSYRYATKWIPFDKKEYIYPAVSSLDFLQREVGQYRVFGNIGGEVGMMYKLPLIEGYDAMYQGRYGEFINAASDGIVVPGDRSVVTFGKYGVYKDYVLQLLGVRYIVHRISDGKNVWAFPVWQYDTTDMKQVYKDNQYEIYEYTKSFPRAFLASSYEVIVDKERIVDRLFSPDFDRRNSLILEKHPDINPSIGEGNVQIISYSPNVIVMKTTSEVNKLLFLSDVYDGGWKATIDGKETMVYRADYDFRAIAVPSGTHTIEYRYHPNQFRIGIIISAIAACSGFALYIWKIKQKK